VINFGSNNNSTGWTRGEWNQLRIISNDRLRYYWRRTPFLLIDTPCQRTQLLAMNPDGERTTGGARAIWKVNNPTYPVGLGERELYQDHVRRVVDRISGI
jgi:hypothetical protein